MDAGLKPEKLNLEARTPEAKEIFKYWLRCFEAYLDSSETSILGPRKLHLLHAQVSHRISTTLEKATTYEEAVEILRKRFVKHINKVHARHLFSTCRQRSGETLDGFVEKLTVLARDCDHQDVTGEIRMNLHIRDDFMSGIRSTYIWHQLHLAGSGPT
ncbi:hypothetical protein scyTo_0012298 [Scyliorhinus torazame]|uniref:Retrotransposon gag domain-containing protein n=1 Tax=Scyliorhinus torazame TaxID=75743 RepID=A0A401P631_SCYTO|nr:hypothetical protein [Scyliorhinus torazame]